MNLKATAQNVKSYGEAAQVQIADVIATQDTVLTALGELRSVLITSVSDEIQKAIDAIEAENYGDAKAFAEGAKAALQGIIDEYTPI